MGRAFIIVVAIALAIFCLVQVLQSRHEQVRLMPRWAWVVVIVLLPVAGSIGWLLLGRAQQDKPPPRPQRRTLAPDDDPDFLRGLNRWERQERHDEPND